MFALPMFRNAEKTITLIAAGVVSLRGVRCCSSMVIGPALIVRLRPGVR